MKNIFIMKNLTDFLKSGETGVDPYLRYYRTYIIILPFSSSSSSSSSSKKKKIKNNNNNNNCLRKINEFELSDRFELA